MAETKINDTTIKDIRESNDALIAKINDSAKDLA